MAAHNGLPPDQAERERIVRELDRTMLVEAAAGTGKTTSMVSRLIALLAAGRCRVHTLAAVTFTRKAAAELRARVQVDLEAHARQATGPAAERLAHALAHVEQCFIGTIHSFCARLLRERPVEAGVDVAFEEMDETVDALLREEAWEEHVATLLATEAPVLAELEELGLEIGQLADAFRIRAQYPDVADWPAPPAPLPDLGPVAAQVRDYARHMDALIPTFRNNPNDTGKDELMGAYARIARMVRHARLDHLPDLIRIAESMDRKPYKKQGDWPGGNAQGKQEHQRWDKFREDVVGPFLAQVRAARYEPALRAIAPALRMYERRRSEAGALNFQDLLLKAAALLRRHPHVRRYFRQRVTHLLVDEFQDTDPIQAEVMLLLTASDPEEADWRRCRSVPGSLFVVGDPKQSIYRFRRADIVTYTQVREIIQGSGGAIVTLSANFRSAEPVIRWVNRAFEGEFPAQATPFQPAYVPLELGRTEPPGDSAGVLVLTVPKEASRRNEDAAAHDAGLIARTIRQAVARGGCPGDFLIVTRTKKRLSVYARALGELGVPHQVTGGSALNEVAELKLLHTALAAVLQPENPVAVVAALRSELFGISDAALYEFRRAGGQFHPRCPVPAALPDATRELFQDAFERLRAHARWLATLPPAAAIEKIAADIGLPVLAAAAPGGNVQAGSLGKALELLRSATRQVWTAADLVDTLAQIVGQDEPHDGLPARPASRDVVRVMNLHKVKGLQAPVVFLADPGGASRHAVTHHIDRTGPAPRGFLAVYGEPNAFGQAPLLAHPADWEDWADVEGQFEDAEGLRLLYVAATRAADRLVITQRTGRNSGNPWAFFASYLDAAGGLPDPGPQAAPAGPSAPLTAADVQKARVALRGRWAAAARPTYGVLAAKRIALAETALRPVAGEHGTEWGAAIHTLLQAAMQQPGADLASLARSALAEQGSDTAHAEAAVEVVRSVMASALWARARGAERCLTEAPFAIALRPDDPLLDPTPASTSVPTVVRGVLDLAFREPDGWVVVDYKTDAVTPQRPVDRLVAHYRPQVRLYAGAWARCTDEPVKEIGLYFTRVGEYHGEPAQE